jgi:hypothetical protein
MKGMGRLESRNTVITEETEWILGNFILLLSSLSVEAKIKEFAFYSGFV